MARHEISPTPWKTTHNCDPGLSNVSDADGCMIVFSTEPADAERIVRSVNTHDALVAALRRLADSGDEPGSVWDGDDDAPPPADDDDGADWEAVVARVRRIARAALREAGETV